MSELNLNPSPALKSGFNHLPSWTVEAQKGVQTLNGSCVSKEVGYKMK